MSETVTAGDSSAAGPSEAEVQALLDALEVTPQSNLIGLLQDVQERFGYLPRSAIERIARRTKVPLSRIYGVVTFYAQFYTEPRGRHTIRCCRGTACHVRGAGRVLESLQRELGIDDGESTPDLFFCLETVACLGTCFLAPVMMIDDRYYGMLTPQKMAKILQSYRPSEQVGQ
jgi:NADH-quinone oxidoreductase subunit E